METEELFLRTLDDLHEAINATDEFDVLRASLYIRQLFMDGGKSLFPKVNRKLRLKKISFEIVDLQPPNIPGLPEPSIWVAPDGIDPRRAPQRLPRVVKNQDTLFKTVVATVDGNRLTVWNVVDFVAHVLGGVHSGEPVTQPEQALQKLHDFRLFSNLNPLLILFKSMGRIILEGMRETKYLVLNLVRFENALESLYTLH